MQNRSLKDTDFLDLSQEQIKNVHRGIFVLDKVISDIVLPYSTMADNKISLSFSRIFAYKHENLINHYLDNFFSQKDRNLVVIFSLVIWI